MRAGWAPGAITVGFVAMMLSGCAVVDEPVMMEAPEWSSGFGWAYIYESTETGEVRMDDEVDPIDEHYQGRRVLEVFNTTVVIDNEPLYHVVTEHTTGDNEGGVSFDVFRQRDLGDVRFDYSTSMACQNTQCTDQGLTITTYHVDGETFLDFPLESGKRWGYEDTEEEDGVIIGVAVQSVVRGAAIVETGLGPVQTARVSTVEMPIGIDDYERMVIEEAEAEGYQIDRYDIEYSYVKETYYSDVYQSVVREDVTIRSSEVATGTDPDGEAFEYSQAVTRETTSILEGARLLPGPERSVQEAYGFVKGALEIRDPAGQAVAASTFDMTISPSSAVINAADHNLSLDAVIDGDVPANTTFHWTLRDANGLVALEGEGLQWSPELDRPGKYSVELLAQIGGSVAASAGSVVTADWLQETAFDCGAVSVGGFPACNTIEVPVFHDARRVLIEAMGQVPTQTAPGNLLILTDPGFYAVYGENQGSRMVIEVDDFTFHTRTGDMWTLEYRPAANALMDLPVAIQVDYSGTEAADSGARMAWTDMVQGSVMFL